MKIHQLATLFLLVYSMSGQTQVDVRTQTKNVDFSGAASTIPAKSGSSLPSTCKVGEMFFNTSNSPGQNLYTCAPANTWTVVVGGGSTNGTVLAANNGQFAFYGVNGATVGGHTLVAGDIPALNYQSPLIFTGNGAKTASSTGSYNSNNCAKWDNNGNLIDAGSPCGSGSSILQASSHYAEGDSITAGFLVTPTTSYPALLAADEGAALTNRGISGAQACDMAAQETIAHDIPTVDHNPIYTSMIGTNDANHHPVGDGYEPIFQGCHKAALAWIATAYKQVANSSTCTETGSWIPWSGIDAFPSADFSRTNGATKSCPIKTFGGPIYAWYWIHDGDGGAFTYSVDGGTPVAVTTGTTPQIATFALAGTAGWNLIRVPVAAGAHTILFTVTSPTGSGNTNNVAPIAIGTTAPQATYGSPRVYVGGVPKQQADANSAATAGYNADVLADVNLLAGDGLGVYFVDVRKYLCTSVSAGLCVNSTGVADMQTPGTSGDGGLHPNAVGHVDLKQAWENIEQFTPYLTSSSGGGSGSGTVNSGTSGQFATYSASGTAVSGHTLVASDIPALSYDASGAAATAQAASLQKSNNLSDLANAATARTNLGLGTAATQASTTFQSTLTFTGNGTRTASATAAGVNGNCARWDASGNISDAGSPCGSGSGGSSAWASLTPGTNTSGAFVVGSGASLAASGTGTIAATSVPASGVSGTLASTNLPVPTATTLGGVNSLAATSHQWINSISTAGLPSSSQPAFSDLSGTLTAAQLPNPSASTLGGVQSVAPVASQWINSINTSGVPVLSQPAFTNISGVASDAQLPTDQCTLTKYTVAFGALTGFASATPSFPLFTLQGASYRVCLVELSGTASFVGTGITAATVRLQSNAAVNPLQYSPNQDIFGAVGPTTNNFWSDAGNTADRTGPGVVAVFTFTGGTSAALSAGSVDITVGIRKMP